MPRKKQAPKIRRPGEGTYYEQPNGTWQYKISVGTDEQTGKLIRKTFYGRTAGEAREKGLAWLQERGGQRVGVSPDMRLGDWVQAWLETYKKGSIKENSYRQLCRVLRVLPESLKHKRCKDVTPIELQAFINGFSQKVSGSYAREITNTLRAAFLCAVENGLVAKSPAAHLHCTAKPSAPREVFTPQEMVDLARYASEYNERVRGAAKDDGAVMGAAVLFLLLTGIRRGELLGLKWIDLDPDSGMIHLRRAVYTVGGRALVEDFQMKTAASIRDIPYPLALQDALTAIPVRGDYVFSTKNGTLMHPANFSRSLDRFFKAMEADTGFSKRLPAHSFRHTFATEVLKVADLSTAQQLLGHTDIKTTARYLHPDFARKSDAVSCLAAAIAGGIPTTFPPSVKDTKKDS
jgi:integrase